MKAQRENRGTVLLFL